MTQFFTADENALFFRLLLSHLLTDFVLQPTSWVLHKQQKLHRSKYLYWHSLVAGILAYVFVGFWAVVSLIVFVGITHGLIDYLKLRFGGPQPLRPFLIDQVAHVCVLLLVWLWLTDNWIDLGRLVRSALTEQRVVAVLSGYLICTTPIGFIVGMATSKWQRQLIDPLNPSASDSLDDAGKWIGIAERVLIFSFVLLNQYEAIGFLIAAKSLLRFREGEKAAKQSEYVLVGTLLSYSMAILIGLMTKLVIE
ncbi:DUF3307 domain-containing protein [Fibrisoma montanum]|uniref:DUF3307 domain-containing protein n=1 Tax=Fibrisoma montanum TaxID=2305895 RepID=A0A418MBK2_9BACT|nr:DUF3307 domain-containing protein [Fibrisoma montanum]RIV23763.1 DUF3307 domain-containing protein [Fibrisoma montanum]